jgi:hypothetical protein
VAGGRVYGVCVGRYGAVEEGVLDKLVDSCNADIRQMLNLLQIWQPKDGAPALTTDGVNT